MAVDTNNRTTVTVGGKEYEIEASNGACALYAKEFREKEKKPYTGNLITDISIETAECAQMDNSYPMWCDVPHLEQAIWAMAKAAGSTKDSYKTFDKKLMAAPAVYLETANIIGEIFGEFGSRTFFRNVQGQSDAGVPDNESEKEEGLHVV